MTQNWSELIQGFLRIVICMFSIFFATTADRHLGLLSHKFETTPFADHSVECDLILFRIS